MRPATERLAHVTPRLAVGELEEVRAAAIAPRHERLDVRLARLKKSTSIPFGRSVFSSRRRFSSRQPCSCIGSHWNGVQGFRYERVHGKRNAAHPPALAGEAEHHLLADPHGDARHPEDVLGLGGQAAHEIHLHVLHPLRERVLGGPADLVVGEVLVDDLPHPLGARLGGDRDRALAACRHPAGQLGSDRVHAQGRRAERAAEFADVAERVEPRVVGGVRADEPEPEAALDALLRPGAQRLEIHLPVRALDEPRRAEAAAPEAAARDLGEEQVAELRVGRVDHARRRPATEVGDVSPQDASRRRRAARSR